MAAIESGVVTKRLPLRLQELEEEEEKLKAELDFAKASDFIITPEQIEFLLWQFVDPLDDESWEDYKRRIIKCFVQSVFLDETMSEEELDYPVLFPIQDRGFRCRSGGSAGRFPCSSELPHGAAPEEEMAKGGRVWYTSPTEERRRSNEALF